MSLERIKRYLCLFLRGVSHQRKDYRLRLPYLVRCGQLCPSSSHITSFFDHRYLQKESIYVLVFLHGDGYQGKAASEAIALVWCGQVYIMSLKSQDSLIIKISGRSLSITQIFCMDIIIKGRHLKLLLLVGRGQVCLSSNQLATSLINHISRRNQFIPQIFSILASTESTFLVFYMQSKSTLISSKVES